MLTIIICLWNPGTSASFQYYFFFNDTATTEIYTLSLHDALPISPGLAGRLPLAALPAAHLGLRRPGGDRKSTRLNSSHMSISYAVFCLKKKKTHTAHVRLP